MIRRNLVRQWGAVLAMAMAMGGLFPAAAAAGDLKLEGVLVWGTNDGKVSDPNLKPVTAGIAKRLACLPFKYTNYFEVNRKQFALPVAGATSVKMSKDCKIDVRSLEGGKIEVTLIGKGQPVGKITQEIEKNKTLVTGGNAANSTAWFVIIRQIE